MSDKTVRMIKDYTVQTQTKEVPLTIAILLYDNVMNAVAHIDKRHIVEAGYPKEEKIEEYNDEYSEIQRKLINEVFSYVSRMGEENTEKLLSGGKIGLKYKMTR